MPVIIAYILGGVFAVAGTVVACIFIVPEKKRVQLSKNKFLLVLHDIVNFNSLLIEKILKVMYILSTLFSIICGFFMLFSGGRNYWGDFQSDAPLGLIFMIVGPFVIRLFYESLMMFIILVNKTVEINNKINYKGKEEETPEPIKIQAKMVYCTNCGTHYDKNSSECPKGCQEQ